MPHRMLQQAISLMREGKVDAGARMLNVVIRDPNLSNAFRATAYAWLAESREDVDFKIDCLNRALDSDPKNTHIQERLNYYLNLQSSKLSVPAQRPPTDTNWGTDALEINRPMVSSQPLPTLPNQTEDDWETDRREINRPLVSSQPLPTPPNRNDPITPISSPLSQSQQPIRLNQTPRIVGIQTETNETGSGVFVTTDGMIATTRYVVGGRQELTVVLDTGQQLSATAVRAYPQYDLALLQTNATLDRVWPPIQVPVIIDNETLIVTGFNSKPQQATKRQTKQDLPPHWIATNLDLTTIDNAGGNPIYDSQNYLVGLLTRNASRSSGMVYGLHIMKIYECVKNYLQEHQQNTSSDYCPQCGSMTRAQQFGGYYCETCGSMLPSMEDVNRIHRSSPQLLQLYGDNLSRPCPNCSAKVGYYNSECLRCGYDLESGKVV